MAATSPTERPRESAPINIDAILAAIPLLSGLRPPELRTLRENLKLVKYAPDAFLCREGEEGKSFFIIADGEVEVTTEAQGHIATLRSGDYAGEQALMRNARRNASLHALTRTKCFVIDQETFRKVLAENTHVRFAKREAKRNAVLTEFEDLQLHEATQELDDDSVEFLVQQLKDEFPDWETDFTRRIARRMEPCDFAGKGTFVYERGHRDANLYVISNGQVSLVDEHGVRLAKKVKGEVFNAVSLFHNESATVSARIDTAELSCFKLSGRIFQFEKQTGAKKDTDQRESFLRKVDLCKPLLTNELSLLAAAVDEVLYEPNTQIFAEGDDGDKFYIIRRGRVRWSKSNGEQGVLSEGSFFGERALRTQETRAATITTGSEPVVLLELSSNEFIELLGPVLEIIDDKIKSYVRANNEAARSSAIVLPDDNAPLLDENDKIPMERLETIGLLGKGGFGLVTLVVDQKTNLPYALKAIRKDIVVKNKHQKHIIGEKRVMDILNSPFLVNLRGTYKDELRVYFLLDVCLGGELFTILRQFQYFDERTARFYAACVVEAFDYMHSHSIVHRDLKPENLVLDEDGYARLTDFGFAKRLTGTTYTLCGTPDYLAPEIVTGKGHSYGVDWWTLGILIYEMLEGSAPFYAEQHIDTYKKIVKGKIHFPSYFSTGAKSLIRGLLHPKPTRRFGVIKGGADNIRNHAWFRGFHWKKFQQRKLEAPIRNKVKDARDLSNFRKAEIPHEHAEPISPADDFAREF